MIEVRGVSKRFGRVEVLRGIDLAFAPGRVTGIVGPNAAGKTTLIKIMLGLTHADCGTVALDGTVVGVEKHSRDDYRARIGYMPQAASFPDNLTGEELVALLRALRGWSPVTEHAFDDELFDRFELHEPMKQPLRVLSGGTRQKVNAAIAFAFRPDVLILDEPTAGLDPVSSAIVKDKLLAERRDGRTVIVTCHVMSELEEICDDVVLLLEGRVRFAGDMRDLMRDMRQRTLERAIAALMCEEAAA